MQVSFLMIGVVLVAMKLLLLLRAVAQKELGAGWMAGVCNGIVIYVLNNWFGKVAVFLTDWENHRDQKVTAIMTFY